jgi:hypothetical protein
MNPQTENKQQPNYDFILQQGADNPQSPAPKKPKNKMFIGLLVGGGFFILVLLGLAVYVSVTTNVQQVDTNAVAVPEEAGQRFIQAMAAQQYEEIISNQLATGLVYDKNVNREILMRIGNGIDFSQCTPGEPDAENSELSYICEMTSAEKQRRLVLGFEQAEGVFLISSHKVEQL